ncbi:MAG: NADH-quinone oxidoreductase subunit F [Gammaproteobacteria bacterium]|nr:NADH-quinone oxidoreductase subunit F [Gammaproteobacteria bacterium]
MSASHAVPRVEDTRAIRQFLKTTVGAWLDRKDGLIECLHGIQDAYGCLPKPILSVLAELRRQSVAELFGVASFYHHFHVVDGIPMQSVQTVRVCQGVSCALQGAASLLETLTAQCGAQHALRIEAAPCVGRCEHAPVAVVGQQPLHNVSIEAVVDTIGRGEWLHPASLDQSDFDPVVCLDQHGGCLPRAETVAPDWVGLEAYLSAGGYQQLAAIRRSPDAAEHALAELSAATLRGLGGAGFPAGRKWSIVKQQPAPRLLVVNLDEGEPGTFKDRTYLERDPHRFLEGLLIAAQVVDVHRCYIYLRDEYAGARAVLQRSLEALVSAELVAPDMIELRRGAGAYICGEESALIESIEGHRGEPRHRPPYVAERGLFGRPTLVHNFETLYWVRDILARGARWWNGFGRHGRAGLRSYSVSGRVREPGVKLAPAGITLSELIHEYCGGMAPGHTLYGYFPGGASGGLLPATMADLPLDFDTLQSVGCFIGSAAIVVFSEADRARDLAEQTMAFFQHESCGQCTPCREGTHQARAQMQVAQWDSDALSLLADVLREGSICGLGQAAPNTWECVQRYFPHEVARND